MVCLGIILATPSIAEASIFTNKNGISNNGASRGSNLITAAMSVEMHCVAPRDTILPRPFVGPSSEEKGLVRVATGDNLMDPSITLDEVVYGEGMSSVTSDTNNANGELYFAAPQSIELPKPFQKNELRHNADKSLTDCPAFLSSAIIYGASIMFLSSILVLLLCTNPMKTNASLPYFTVRNGSQKLRGRGCGISNYLVTMAMFATLIGIGIAEAEVCGNIYGLTSNTAGTDCRCGTTDCCTFIDFQPETVQPVQIKGANIPSRTNPLLSVMKMLDMTSMIPTKTIAKSGREQLDVDKALCFRGVATKLEYLFNGVNKCNESNANVDFHMEANVVEKVSNVMYFIFCLF